MPELIGGNTDSDGRHNPEPHRHGATAEDGAPRRFGKIPQEMHIGEKNSRALFVTEFDYEGKWSE